MMRRLKRRQMCGRFYIDEEIYADARGLATRIIGDPGAGRRLPADIYPDEMAPILKEDGTDTLLMDMKWGFPRYRGKGLYINARAETALEKPTFRDSALSRRCIIPARHFYEWDPEKDKFIFADEKEAPLYMAGLYNLYGDEDRFVILTTEANDSVSPVHPRMPLILKRDEIKPWIFSGDETDNFLKERPELLKRQQAYQQQNLFE